MNGLLQHCLQESVITVHDIGGYTVVTVVRPVIETTRSGERYAAWEVAAGFRHHIQRAYYSATFRGPTQESVAMARYMVRGFAGESGDLLNRVINERGGTPELKDSLHYLKLRGLIGRRRSVVEQGQEWLR